jgi:hypothetical protein
MHISYLACTIRKLYAVFRLPIIVKCRLRQLEGVIRPEMTSAIDRATTVSIRVPHIFIVYIVDCFDARSALPVINIGGCQLRPLLGALNRDDVIIRFFDVDISKVGR